MAEDVDRLIGLLDHDDRSIAEDAKAELASLGRRVLEPLIAAVPGLERYGRLSAIEIFEELGDPAAGPVLIDLLDNDDETVRGWSASALAALHVRQAVPALQAAYRRHRSNGDGPDVWEAMALRHALTALGGRRSVIPPLTASWAASREPLESTWPAARLEQVINDLADHGQVVLYFQVWQVIDGQLYGRGHDSLDAELDWQAPWPQVVEAARQTALLEAAFVPDGDNVIVTVEWIDEADR